MAKDGRLTIRFDDLIDQIRVEAARVEMKPGTWVKRQVRRVIRKRAKQSKAAPREAGRP